MIEHTYYQEAMRYIDNAKESLAKTSIEDGFYKDEKYVKQAGGITFAGLEKAAIWWLRLGGYKKELKNNYEIKSAIGSMGRKALNIFNSAYTTLHIDIYYNDETDVEKVKLGFERANTFIALLKNYKNLLPEDTVPNHKKLRVLKNEYFLSGCISNSCQDINIARSTIEWLSGKWNKNHIFAP